MIVRSPVETQKFASDLLNNLKKGQNVLALVGDLGSGKTTFTQGIARALGISQRVVSPTFVLMREYKIKDQISKIKNITAFGGIPSEGGTNQRSKILRNLDFNDLYHLDLYRLGNIDEIKELGIEEIWEDPSNLVIIEWAEKVRGILPKNAVWLQFRYINKKTREIATNFQFTIFNLQ